jgi:class 3 adenylate cyclase
MQSEYSEYNFQKSLSRIDRILEAKDASYEERRSIPLRTALTLTNGFYVNCCALFIDVRNSSDLPDQYRRPTLAKIYRAFISECVAIINGNKFCEEVNIYGDAVWGVFDGTSAQSVDTVFETAAQLRSLVKALDCRLKQSGMKGIEAGIGLTYGQVLMIKAGLEGSWISEVVWMGDVVNHASNLAGLAAKGQNKAVLLSGGAFDRLCETYKTLLKPNEAAKWYEGEVVYKIMEEWHTKNCT